MATPPYVSGTETVNKGTFLHGGNTSENSIALGNGNKSIGVALVQRAHIQSVFKNSAVTITSVADSGGGFCKFTLNSHGLAVGAYLMISGATANSLNTVHKITAKDTNTFTTNVPYVASATAGDYQTVNGTMGKMVAGKYVGWTMTDALATVSSTVFNTTGNKAVPAIRKLESARRLDISSINAWTGAVTKGGNQGDSYNYKDALGEGSPYDQAATPSRAVPGELVFIEGSTTPAYKNYKAKTG